uniref:PH domain-containing protein n=1 Tax=Romanomermis culicivorax TaxID=13658 RepID=A0A915KKC8_ROMCU
MTSFSATLRNDYQTSGDLLKFTNAFQGYQHRWCVIDRKSREFKYYIKQENWEFQKPRGTLLLNAETQILLNDDDLLTFTIAAYCVQTGHLINCKFRAQDAKSRQEWIGQLISIVAEETKTATSPVSQTILLTENVRRGLAKEGEMFQNLQKAHNAYIDQQRHLCRTIDTMKVSHDGCLDATILALKANSNALAICFSQCVHSLKDLQSYYHEATRQQKHNDCDSNSFALLEHYFLSFEEKMKTLVKRFTLLVDKISWSTPYPNYNPPSYTDPYVLRASWADPELENPNFKPKFNDLDGKVNRQSYHGPYKVCNGYPLNVTGRTGLRGRGLLGKWGPNHAADPVVTRYAADHTQSAKNDIICPWNE